MRVVPSARPTHVLPALCLCLLACDVDLYHGLGERQANEAVLALRAAGVAADKAPDQAAVGGRPATYRLTAAAADETRALQLLSDQGLPRLPEPTPQAAGLLALPDEGRRAELQHKRAEIAATLEELPQVLQARVHLVVPEDDALKLTGAARPTAAVLLRLRPGKPRPDAAAEAQLQRLVAAAVPGLDPADVTLVSVATPGPDRLGSTAALSSLAGAAPGSAARRGLGAGLIGLALVLVVLGWRRRAL